MTGYSAFRIFEESLRVDPSEHFLGLRLNLYVAAALTVAGAAWYWRTQRRPDEHPGPLAAAGALMPHRRDGRRSAGDDERRSAPGAL